MLTLLVWISSNTSFTYNSAPLPDIHLVSHDQLVEMLFESDALQNRNSKDINVEGLYNFLENDIYLLEDIDLSTAEGKSALIHELIHYLQYQNGLDKTVACRQNLEKAAYGIQEKYLAQQNKKPPFNDLTVLLVSSCWLN